MVRVGFSVLFSLPTSYERYLVLYIDNYEPAHGMIVVFVVSVSSSLNTPLVMPLHT